MPDATTPALVAVTNPDPNAPDASPLPTSGDAALVPYQGPDGSPGDAIVTPATDSISTYLVKSGDTLSEIAASYGVSVNTIVWANNLGSTKVIHEGQTLVILPVSGIQHTVGKGETLASIAKKYGGNANDIADYNGLASGSALVAGSILIIPGGELAATATSGTKSPPKTSSGSGGAVPGNTSDNPYRGGSGAEIDGYYINPVPGAILTQGLHGENAVDLGIAKGTPVHAAAAGSVIVAASGGWNGGYGNYVVIAHGNGTETLYAHLTGVYVSVGQSVDQGSVLGTVGRTGDATGPHLHFEVRGARNPFVASINAGLCHLNRVCVPQ